MRTAALIAGIVVSVVLLAAAGVLYTLAAGSNAAHYRTTIELVRQSEQLAAAWSVETARVKADPLADFDALAAFLPRMARLTERLSEAALRTPDLPDRLAAEVRGYIAALAAKEERIERFKTGYAVVRNSERFLPLAAAAVSREAQALGEVALASTVATLLQEVSLYLATPSDEAAERLRGELSALREASLAHPPTLANALANLLAHAEVLLERHTPTETLFAEATSNDVSVQADALAQSLAFERARAEARATLYERGMLAAIAVLALFWIGLALQSRARAARAAPAEAEAPRPAPAPRLGAPEPSLRTPLALPDEPLEPAFGAIKRELAGALPVPMGAEHAMLERFRAERTGESLAATAERLATRIDVLHHVQARLHAALKESDAMPELPDGSDLDEELEAGLAVAAHARREANAMADLAKRLATVASLPNGDAERDMVDVNACIEDILAATRADAAATVTRRLGDVPDIFASKTEVRLLLAQVLENSLRALEGVAGRPPTIKVDTAQRSDEILITVIDNGAGIPPERRQSIFRPFYTSHDGAMGLGLTLAGDLVRRYEGAIKVNSLPGQGTVTRITLPTGIPGP